MDFSRIENIVEECFKRSVVKLGFLMDSNDNDIMLKNYNRYKGAVEETDILSFYTTLEMSDFEGTDLAAIPNLENAKACTLIPSKVYEFLDSAQSEKVLINARKRIVETYVEKNTYVRVLNGLPSLNDDEEVFITGEYKDLVADHTLPVHKMTDADLENLYTHGILQKLVEQFPNKTYIQYLHRRTSIINIRETADFDLVKAGVVPGEEILSATFKERWIKNRDYFMNSHHNVFYQRTTDYYEALISMILAWSVRVDMIRDSGFDIENDYYDDYELAAILDDFSMSLEGLPLDIKRKVAANMNILVRNRGTVKVLENLCDIFDMQNVYNYVIQKVYIDGKPNIRCHAVPVKDMKNMRKYLTREYGFISYDKLISGDATFSDKGMSARTTRTIEKKRTTDGYINTYHALLEKDFSYIHSKYVAVDNFIDMSQTSLDFALFYNYLLEADPLISSIKVDHRLGNFKLSLIQLYAYLCTLLSWKYKFVDHIPASSADINYVTGLNHSLNLRKVPNTDPNMVEVYLHEPGDIKTLNNVEYLDGSKEYLKDKVDTNVTPVKNIPLARVIQGESTSEYTLEITKDVNIINSNSGSSSVIVTSDINGIDNSKLYFTGSEETSTSSSSSGMSSTVITSDINGIDNSKLYFTGTINIPEEPEFDTIDLVHIFEMHFSGTPYMNLLLEWMNYNPGGTINDFMDTYAHDRRFINTLREIMNNTYDNEQYQICKKVIEKCTTIVSKNNTFGTFLKYSDYLASVNPQAFSRLKNLKSTTSEASWSEKFSNEITYTLKIMKDFIASLNSGEYDESVSFLDDIRDTQLNEVKNVLSYLVNYFLSMSTTIRDPEFTYELGDELDTFRAREEFIKAFDKKKLNNFNHIEDEILIERTKTLPEEDMHIRDALYIGYTSSKRYTKIGGDYGKQ